MNSDINKAIGIIIAAIILALINPIIAIWAWNVLFGAVLTIPLTFPTWLAVGILLQAIRPFQRTSSK